MSPKSTNLDSKTSEPERFDGTNISSREFLVQVRLTLECSPTSYPSERAKCLFLLSLLKGAALKWATPLYEMGDPILNDFEQFSAALAHTFPHVEDTKITMNKLFELRQGADSVATYIGNFSQLSASLDCTQTTLMQIFERGLCEKIQEALVIQEPPASLADLMNHATRIEQRMASRVFARPSEPYHRPPAYQPRPPTKVLEAAKGEEGEIQVKWQELNPRQQRYLYRSLYNLCRYCGAADHQSINCTTRKDDKPPSSGPPPLKGKGQSQH